MKTTEENYRTIFETAANLIAVVDNKGIILDCNGRIEEMLGYTREEIVGWSITELFHPEHLSRAYETFKEVIKKGFSHNKEFIMVRKDGVLVYGNVNSTPLKNEKGKISRVISIVEDITERKRAQEGLLESERRYRHLIEISPDAVLTLNEGRIIFGNRAAFELFGVIHPREVVGKLAGDFVNPEDKDIFATCIKKIEETGGLNDPIAIRMNRRDGADVYAEWIGTAFMQKEKATVLLIGRDVTARKCAENQLKESEERYRISIESSNDGVTILKGDSYLYVNRKFAEMFGFKNVDEILGKHISLILHPDDRERVVKINGMRQRGEDVPSRYEFKGMKKDGNVLYIEVSATPITYKGEGASLIYLRDITERKRM